MLINFNTNIHTEYLVQFTQNLGYNSQQQHHTAKLRNEMPQKCNWCNFHKMQSCFSYKSNNCLYYYYHYY